MHDFLTARGLRDRSEISLVMPLPASRSPRRRTRRRRCSPRSPSAASSGHPNRLVRRSTRPARSRCSADGTELPYDLFLGVPVHRAPAVVEESGLTVDGWIPVDPLTLETSLPRRVRGR